MHTTLVSLALALLVAAPKAEEKLELKTVTSKEGKFSVKMFTDKPSISSQKVGEGDIEMTIVASESEDKGKAILVFFNDYSDELVKNKGAKQILADVLKGSTQDAKLIKNSDVKIGKHPGIEYEAVKKDPELYIKTRCYLVGNRLYQVMVIGDEEFVKATAKDVHDSFKLTEDKK